MRPLNYQYPRQSSSQAVVGTLLGRVGALGAKRGQDWLYETACGSLAAGYRSGSAAAPGVALLRLAEGAAARPDPPLTPARARSFDPRPCEGATLGHGGGWLVSPSFDPRPCEGATPAVGCN